MQSFLSAAMARTADAQRGHIGGGGIVASTALALAELRAAHLAAKKALAHAQSQEELGHMPTRMADAVRRREAAARRDLEQAVGRLSPEERPTGPVPPPPGMPSLATAAKRGDVEALRWWLETAGKAPDFRNPMNGDTLLHLACEAGEADAVRYLLSRGADPNRPCMHKNGGSTPLHRAIRHPGCVAELLRARCDVDATCLNGSALHMVSGSKSMICSGCTWTTEQRALLETARLLLDAGADVQAPHPRGATTARGVAQRSGFADMEELLGSRGG